MAEYPLPICAASNCRETWQCPLALALGSLCRCKPDSCAWGHCVGGLVQQGELQPVGRQERGEWGGCVNSDDNVNIGGEGHGPPVETLSMDQGLQLVSFGQQ